MPARTTDIRLSDVVTLLAVRRHGAISAAARELNVTASQVSKAVVRLERRLGGALLVRQARGVTLTPRGQEVLPVLDELEARLRGLSEPGVERARHLTVTAPSYLNSTFTPAMAEALPQYRFRAIELPPPLIRAYAVESYFDVAVVAGDARLPVSWDVQPLGPLRKVLLCTPQVAKSLGRPPVSPAAVAELTFASPISYASGQFLPADDGCPLPAAGRRRGHEANTFALAVELAVQSGQAVFGPLLAARAALQQRRLVEVPVRGWNVSEPLHLACNQDRLLSGARSALLHECRKALEAGQGR
ncbi:MAG TPA: LysR family transcriptional regulator [Myxococcales bacterium]|nr:LysR family transcriptional regulator [Myxococcales bacterium]